LLLRIFGPKEEEGRGSWRKFRNEELHSFNSSTEIIRRIEREGHVRCKKCFEEF
jgi:hypothetical protein